MSRSGPAERIAVFALFAALGAGALALCIPLAPAGAPAAAELEALERSLVVGARLHPAADAAAPAGSATFCAECHPGPPHAGRRVADAMENEHASRMDCLLCHWTAANGPRPAPSWQVPSGAPPFLAVLRPERATRTELGRLRSAVTAARRCFERGPGCDGCHRPGAIAHLARPGSSSGRLAALERLESYFTLAPGEKWYFPQFP